MLQEFNTYDSIILEKYHTIRPLSTSKCDSLTDWFSLTTSSTRRIQSPQERKSEQGVVVRNRQSCMVSTPHYVMKLRIKNGCFDFGNVLGSFVALFYLERLHF